MNPPEEEFLLPESPRVTFKLCTRPVEESPLESPLPAENGQYN